MRKFKNIIILSLFLVNGFSALSQKTIYGVVTNSGGRTLKNVIVKSNFGNSTKSNKKGEYKIIVSDTCKVLFFTYKGVEHAENIKNSFVINVELTEVQDKIANSLNPRKDYPWGLQLTVGGHSLATVAVNYFKTPKRSFEAGICGRGFYYGTRWYFPLNDEGNNQALYLGAISNLSLDRGIKLYFPFGYHVISRNGMAFGIELAGAIPLTDEGYTRTIRDYVGVGINFGFQF